MFLIFATKIGSCPRAGIPPGSVNFFRGPDLEYRPTPVMMRHVLFALLVCLGGPYAGAQDIRFFVKLSSDTLLAGHLLQVTYILENAELRGFQPPDFYPFSIVNGPQQSSSMRIVQGRMSQEASVTYLLAAETPGTWTLEPARIERDGKVLECPRRQVVVQPNPGELPDPRFPGWRPRQAPPPPGDTLREILRRNRPAYRM
jgi:hypothetical protein